MKINKFIGLVACAMTFSACQNDVLEGGMQQNKIYTLSGNMSAGKAMSRAQIELGNSNSAEEIAYWNEGDAFTLYQVLNKTLTGSVFTISADYKESGDDKKNAMFSTNQPATVDVKYKAVYPASTRMEGHSVKFDLQHDFDFSGATTVEARNEIWSDYMRNNMYMMAEGTLISGGINVLSFRHLCALARVTYTNATTEIQSIKNLSLGGDQTFTTSTSYNLYGSYQDGSGSTNSYQLNLNGLTVEPGQTVDMYAFFYPHEFNLDGELHLNVNTNSGYKGVRLATTTISEANGGAKGFEAGKRYWFKVTEGSEGLVWSKDFTMETVTIDNKSLSLALQSVLGEDAVTLNEDSCAVMSEILVKSTKELYFNANSSLTSLDGIEVFTGLKSLKLNSTDLESLDLSKCHQLEELYVLLDHLTSYDLSTQTGLKSLTLEGCGLRGTLDLSAFTSLEVLNIAGNDLLKEIVFPNITTLKELNIAGMHSWVSNEKIAEVCEKYSGLESLNIHNNMLTELDLSAMKNLKKLICFDNHFDTVLDITPLTQLEYLECGYSPGDNTETMTVKMTKSQYALWNSTWINYNANTSVSVEVDGDGGDIPAEGSITIKNKELAAALKYVLGDKVTIDPDYGYAIMKEDDVLEITELNLSNYTGTITSLANGIEFFENLITLDCRNVGLVTCDLSKNTKLVYVDLQSNTLTTLNLMNCTALEQLFCQYNHELYKIDLTGCSKIWNLQAQGTALKELNIPNPKAMDNFLLPAGVSIDLTQYVNLTGLGLSDRGLVNLDMIPTNIKTQLGYLMIDNNNLTTLDLKEYPNLWGIDCSSNNLTSLDLSYGPNLTYLYCFGNKMETLDISSLSNLGNLLCGLQKDNKELTLTLTEAQKTVWEEFWEDNGGCNENVIINVIGGGSTSGSGSNNTSGSDFTIEGIY